MRYAELVTSTIVRDRTPGEAALIVRVSDEADFSALLQRLKPASVMRTRPGPDLPFMYIVECASAFEAGRLERAWKDHVLSRAIGRELRLDERHWPHGHTDDEG